MARDWKSEILQGLSDYDVQNTDAALDADVTLTYLDSNSVALTASNAILGDGNAGQKYLLMCSDATNNIEIKITHHEDGDNQEFTFAAKGDYMALEWNGRHWALLEKSSGVSNST